MNTLSSDSKIEKQNYVLVSFLSPERVKTTEASQLYADLLLEKDLLKKCHIYDKLLNLKSGVRGLKVRGVFDSIEEARSYSKKLNETDPNFDIYVGSVGDWMPWDDMQRTEENEYAEEELNKLMKEYDKQQQLSKKEHEERKNRVLSKNGP